MFLARYNESGCWRIVRSMAHATHKQAIDRLMNPANFYKEIPFIVDHDLGHNHDKCSGSPTAQ